jgi:hypothetical protein
MCSALVAIATNVLLLPRRALSHQKSLLNHSLQVGLCNWDDHGADFRSWMGKGGESGLIIIDPFACSVSDAATLQQPLPWDALSLAIEGNGLCAGTRGDGSWFFAFFGMLGQPL